MGNVCCGSAAEEGNNLQRGRARREEAWASTGVISLRDAKLKDYPGAVERAAGSARVIDAAGNSLTSLPPFLSALTSLQRLVLSRNDIQALPDLSPLAALRILALDSNCLASVPDSVSSLRRLEQLSLARNRLRQLPAALGALARLRRLDVSGNQLARLPEELGRCSELEELAASANELVALPEALGALQRLKTLDLDANRLAAVPPAVLQGCAALQTLKLHGNPVTPEALQATPGYADFEARRQGKFSKALGAGVMLPAAGLDEGVDRRLAAAAR